jgi:hypothetical protein
LLRFDDNDVSPVESASAVAAGSAVKGPRKVALAKTMGVEVMIAGVTRVMIIVNDEVSPVERAITRVVWPKAA